MPLLPTPDYSPALAFRHGHVQTLYPTLFRSPPATSPVRERLETEDGDFLDIDWHFSTPGPDAIQYASRLAVISHGLEGNSRKKYMLGMAAELTGQGWDVICLNFRGCSGEINRLPRLYHSGVTDDLHRVLCHGLAAGGYDQAALIGFSMGGNQTLKYLGESAASVPRQVVGAAVFSVPVLLADAAYTMDRISNRVYMEYFMAGLRKKIEIKAKMFPEIYDTDGLKSMKTFRVFDEKYTAPVHGFRGAEDYYRRASSHQFLSSINVPTLLVQAQDDPFLPPSCYPYRQANESDVFYLETPRFGGHVGFINGRGENSYWMDGRAGDFLQWLSRRNPRHPA